MSATPRESIEDIFASRTAQLATVQLNNLAGLLQRPPCDDEAILELLDGEGGFLASLEELRDRFAKAPSDPGYSMPPEYAAQMRHAQTAADKIRSAAAQRIARGTRAALVINEGKRTGQTGTYEHIMNLAQGYI